MYSNHCIIPIKRVKFYQVNTNENQDGGTTMKVAIVTANTEVYRGLKEDAAGKCIKEIMEEAGHEIVFIKALPCDKKVLSTVMQRMADAHLTDLMLTTGGAGCAPTDCTPEATMDVVERAVLGIPEAMRAYTLQVTKRSMLNRSVAGIRGNTLIVNLPGNANAVKQCLEYLLPEITHAVEVIKGA